MQNGFTVFGRDEYWVCKNCGSYNHIKDDECWFCKEDRK